MMRGGLIEIMRRGAIEAETRENIIARVIRGVSSLYCIGGVLSRRATGGSES